MTVDPDGSRMPRRLRLRIIVALLSAALSTALIAGPLQAPPDASESADEPAAATAQPTSTVPGEGAGNAGPDAVGQLPPTSTPEAPAADSAAVNSESAADQDPTEAPASEGGADAKDDEPTDLEATAKLAPPPPPPPPPEEEAAPAQPTSLGGQWLQRVEDLETAIENRTADQAQADALYPQLRTALNATSQRLKSAMESGAEDTPAVYRDLVSIYVARLKLITLVHPVLRAEIKGFDAVGIEECRGEWAHIRRHTRYHVATIRQRGAEQLEEYLASPLKGVRELLGTVLLIVFFRWWRRSGSKVIQRWRQLLMTQRPRRRINIWLAKILWYSDRVRGPIEWLLLLNVLERVLIPDQAYYAQLLWIVVRWVLLGWFLVLLIDAMAARAAVGKAQDDSGLRMRSLRWLGGWFVMRGMVLDLVASYGGEGTIYAWFSTFAVVILLPILAVVVVWWREQVFARLEKRRDLPRLVAGLKNRKTGISGFLSAALGGLYLMVQGIFRRLLGLFSTFEIGKRILAYFFRREVAKQSERQRRLAAGRPVSKEIAERLLDRGGPVHEKVGRKELQTLITLSRSVERGTGALIGERGSGKTRLLERLKSSLGDAALVIDCPRKGFEGLLAELAKGLGLPLEVAGDEGAIGHALENSGCEVVVVDNFHLLSLPAIGGLKEIDRLLRFEAKFGPHLSWIISLDSAAWQYIRRLRSDLLLAHQIVQIKPWTDRQIGELIETRTEAAGIDPDFDQLVLPAHLNETGFDGEESAQAGFYRIIWDSAKGNPEVAIRLWVQSLVVLDDGNLAVRLFPPATYEELERLDPLMLFGLRAILMMETATPEEIRKSLRISADQVGEILRSALNMGLIEEADGRCSIPWRWYRPLSTVLTRQNLMKI